MKKEIPRVNRPAGKGPYKVIQLFIEDEPHVVIGDCLDYHGIILKRFLDENNIPYETRSDEWTSKEIPLVSGDNYKAVGMGNGNIWPKQKKAIFEQKSMSYGLLINKAHLDKIRELEPDWDILNDV